MVNRPSDKGEKMNRISTQAATVRRIHTLLVSACLVAAMPATAADTPRKLAGVTVVTADEVKKMMAAGVPVIDTRVADEYAESHIKGAKSVPY